MFDFVRNCWRVFLDDSRIYLDGTWEFLHVRSDDVSVAQVRSIKVPAPWQAQFDDLRARAGIGIYRRIIQLPEGWMRERVFLRFGAVFHNANVWINGAHVGAHEGGFLPFSFDITDHIAGNTIEVKVRVESPTDDPAEFPEAPFAEIPFGKQSWYGPLSGIWQSVYLERRIPDHVHRVRVFSDQKTGDVSLQVCLAAPLLTTAEICVTVVGPDGEPVQTVSADVAAGLQTMILETRIPEARPWSPDDPKLYRIEARVIRNGAVVDEMEDHFGFRTIETRGGRLYLNGEPFYLRAALDQDYYPDTICTTPSVAFLEDQFRKAKELGLNALRCHIKAPDPRYYEAADRIGLLIWAELPNGGFSTTRSRARKERTLNGIIDRDSNHPCIFCWTLINENWGVDLVHDPHHRKWLKDLYVWIKAYDPGRLAVDNSPLAPSFHVRTDLADYHFYAAIPDSRADWDGFVTGLASRAEWLFSREGDAESSGEEPLICSEFGNWGLPNPEQLLDSHGEEPWWFETGHDWGEGVMYPHGVENRFIDWSLDRVFGDFETFVSATQWQQYRALKYEIETMRRRPEIAGYVITEFTDCHWEANGLLDMRRNRRVFHDEMSKINADTVIVPSWSRVSFWAGETASVDIAIAHGGPRPLEPGILRAALDGAEIWGMQTAELASHHVRDLGPLQVPIPAGGKSRMRRVTLELRSDTGVLLAQNHLDLAVLARRDATTGDDIRAWSSDPGICERLALLGYGLADTETEATLVVASATEPWLPAFVRNGGRLVLLPESDCPLYPFFPHWQNVKVTTRQGTPWRGDWASSFAWVRRRGPFAALPGGPLIDEVFDRVIPTHVITGCNLLDFQARVHAGLAVGWVHRPVALCVERNYGQGRIVASTFRLLRDAPGEDPTATTLLDGMVRLALAEQAPAVGTAELGAA